MRSVSIERSIEILRHGGVIVGPSDSCYGLIGDALNEATVQRILAIKARSPSRPPAVFVPVMERIDELVVLAPTSRRALLSLLPGPFTVLVAATDITPAWLMGDKGLLGIRMVHFEPLSILLRESGLFLTATSANRTGLLPPYRIEDLADRLDIELVDGMLTFPCGGQPPSTVVDVTSVPPQIAREGMHGASEVQELLEEGNGANRHSV